MKTYKIRHMPTGLFFTPSRGNGNLSAKGNAYVRKPDIGWGECLTMNRVPQGDADWHNRNYYDTNKVGMAIKKWLGKYPDTRYVHTTVDQWEIIEYLQQ
jgi:hypothetical protein